MILMYRGTEFKVPHTSTCTIRTVGQIKNGDTVRVTSPVFPSYNLTSYAVTSSTEFEVPVRLSGPDDTLESDGTLLATLVCNDNDTQHMFVRERT